MVTRTIALLIVFAACVHSTSDPPLPALEKKTIAVKEHDCELAMQWYDLELKLIRRKPVFTPPIAARLLGYTGIILYESLVGGMPGYLSISGSLDMPRLPAGKGQGCNYVITANAAFSSALKHFIPSLSPKDIKEVNELETYFNEKYSNETNDAEFAASANYGKQIAENIYQWAKTDGGEDGKFSYFRAYSKFPSLPGMWQATSFAGALLPDWRKNRPFIRANILDCQPPPPPAYSDKKNSALYSQAMDVYTVYLHLTSEQADIAKYWADPPGSTFTPAGHFIKILCQTIKEKNLSLDMAAMALTKSGIALNDAFISCWQTKYEYNYIRPITYIRKNIKKDWIPFIVTPSFPEYTSGHSVQSAAMAEVMSSLFGNKYSFTDNSNDTLGYTPRHYNSFRECAREAALSRLYGGIHFRISVENGLLQGEKIGANVNKIHFKKE